MKWMILLSVWAASATAARAQVAPTGVVWEAALPKAASRAPECDDPLSGPRLALKAGEPWKPRFDWLAVFQWDWMAPEGKKCVVQGSELFEFRIGDSF